MYRCVTDGVVGKMIGRVEGTEFHSTKRQPFWSVGGGGGGGGGTRLG